MTYSWGTCMTQTHANTWQLPLPFVVLVLFICGPPNTQIWQQLWPLNNYHWYAQDNDNTAQVHSGNQLRYFIKHTHSEGCSVAYLSSWMACPAVSCNIHHPNTCITATMTTVPGQEGKNVLTMLQSEPYLFKDCNHKLKTTGLKQLSRISYHVTISKIIIRSSTV